MGSFGVQSTRSNEFVRGFSLIACADDRLPGKSMLNIVDDSEAFRVRVEQGKWDCTAAQNGHGRVNARDVHRGDRSQSRRRQRRK